MSDILVPAERPGEWTTLGDHERRIRALEALVDCCDQGDVCVDWPDRVAEFASEETDVLRGWWRLGEGVSPFADSSGHSYGPADAVKVVDTTAMTDDITGALPAAVDDGAVQFNAEGSTAGDYLDAPDPPGPASARRFNFDASDGPDMTVAAFVNPTADASTFTGQAVGRYNVASNGGWRIGVVWPARTPFFERRNSSTSTTVAGTTIPADSWSFIVGTYDGTNGHRLYVDGDLVDEDAALFTGLPSANTGPNFGRNSSGSGFESFKGGVDEVTIWGRALTPAEILELFLSGQDCFGAGDGMVLTSDGAGGTFWAFPTIEVLEDGV